ncbi:MAG: GNAT family N-acetyltransferase [Tissierellia bacterium]|nr:GNAT family N-acetyltransferase [Tissierellia bacterium]
MSKHIGTEPLETKRLALRRLTLEDAQPMFQNWANDPEVTEFLTWRPHGSIAVTKAVLRSWIREYENPRNYQWGIVLKETGELMGTISCVGIDDKEDSVEIGYCIGRSWWGMSYMPEALTALIEFFMDAVGVQKVRAKHDPENPASGRVMEKSGMKRIGLSEERFLSNRGIFHAIGYEICRGDIE